MGRFVLVMKKRVTGNNAKVNGFAKNDKIKAIGDNFHDFFNKNKDSK